MNPKPLGNGKFELRLAEDTPQFFVGIHVPGFLQFFDAGPFTMADVKDGVLEIDVPRPAQLDVDFAPQGDPKELSFSGANITVLLRNQRDPASFWEIASATSQAPKLQLVLADLSPGDYRYGLGTEPKPDVENLPGTNINPGKFRDIHVVHLNAGDTKRIDVRYTPPNLKSFRGDRTAKLQFKKPDGTAAAGERVTVQYHDPHYGEMDVFAGEIPENGEVVLDHIAANRSTDWFQMHTG